MAKVAVLLRVLPDEAGIDMNALLEKIKSNLPPKYEIVKTSVEPIAFGLEALRMILYMPEMQAGGTDELERLIQGTEGVSQVDILMVTRVS